MREIKESSYGACARALLALIENPAGHETCEECGGSGRIGHEHGYTDPCFGGGETQWQGYLPTNLCHVCEGTGCWPPIRGGRR